VSAREEPPLMLLFHCRAVVQKLRHLLLRLVAVVPDPEVEKPLEQAVILAVDCSQPDSIE
jgi:hypothetical protein